MALSGFSHTSHIAESGPPLSGFRHKPAGELSRHVLGHHPGVHVKKREVSEAFLSHPRAHVGFQTTQHGKGPLCRCHRCRKTDLPEN